ncbi:hypothetical protein Riv7116_3505 [Rivularia sp. PCC 7116]|nr:hypothetical protein Riv7116_3505 [Rivularia sp. PCC 7116]
MRSQFLRGDEGEAEDEGEGGEGEEGVGCCDGYDTFSV